MVDKDELHDDIDPEDVGDVDAIDDSGIPYNYDRGEKSPVEGRCNALLNKWRQRYGEPRFCGQLPRSTFVNDVDHDYCRNHSNRASMDALSAEQLTHGISAKTRDHLFRNLDAYKQVYAYGIFESLMADSEYEFAPEYEVRQFDFTDSPFSPDAAEDGVVSVKVPYATQFKDREIALLAAAIDSIKMMDAQSIIAEAQMRVESTTKAEFTTASVVGEDGSGTPKSWHTIEEYNEHYLNLAYSRLVRDRSELLEYGGVETTEDADGTDVAIADLDALTTPEPDPKTESPINERAHDTDIEVGVEDSGSGDN
jgi:hypothetical protein